MLSLRGGDRASLPSLLSQIPSDHLRGGRGGKGTEENGDRDRDTERKGGKKEREKENSSLLGWNKSQSTAGR